MKKKSAIIALLYIAPVHISCEMSHKHISLGTFPTELLCRILSTFGPEDIRTLRYITVACLNTDHRNLSMAAEKVLQDQQTWLLDRWRKIYAETSVHSEAPAGIESIAEQVIGKQYVKEEEVIDDSDHWVSFLDCALALL